MNELRELYQEVILDHGRNPRNFGTVADTPFRAEGHNPLCGDRLEVSLTIEDGKVLKARFEGSGCAISMASASLMTGAIEGQELEQVMRMFERFQALVRGELDASEAAEQLGKLAVFSGVRDFPVRVKCATLPWHTMRAAESRRDQSVSTE